MHPIKRSTMILIGLLVAHIQPVLAHEQAGPLAAAGSPIAHYKVRCFDDGNGTPAGLLFNIRASKSSKKTLGVTDTVSKDGQSTTVTDPKSGDAKASDYGYLAQGPGDYSVDIKKSTSVRAAVIYAMEYHCETAAGAHTGTDISR